MPKQNDSRGKVTVTVKLSHLFASSVPHCLIFESQESMVHIRKTWFKDLCGFCADGLNLAPKSRDFAFNILQRCYLSALVRGEEVLFMKRDTKGLKDNLDYYWSCPDREDCFHLTFVILANTIDEAEQQFLTALMASKRVDTITMPDIGQSPRFTAPDLESKVVATPPNEAGMNIFPYPVIWQDLPKGIAIENESTSEIAPQIILPTTTLRKIDMHVYFSGRLSFLPKIQVPRDTVMQQNCDSLHTLWNSRLRFFVANVLFALFPETSNLQHVQRILNKMPIRGLIDTKNRQEMSHGEGCDAFKELDLTKKLEQGILESCSNETAVCSLDFDTSKLHFHSKRWDGTSLDDVHTKPFPDLSKMSEIVESCGSTFALPLCVAMEMVIDDKDMGCTPENVATIVWGLLIVAAFDKKKNLAYACCSTLTKLAGIDVFAATIVGHENGTMYLFQAMKRFPNFQLDHQMEVLVLIERLAEYRYKNVLIGAGAIDMILQALAQDYRLDLHIDALSALHVLTYGALFCKPAPLPESDRIAKVVTQLLKQTTDSSVLKEYCCDILYAIMVTTQSCIDVVLAEDGAPSILRAMCTFANSEMQDSSCRALLCLVCSDQLDKVYVEAVLNALKMHPENLIVQVAGCLFLTLFSKMKCNMPLFVADLAGEAFWALCNAAKHFPNEPFLQAKVWRVVSRLVRSNRMASESFPSFGICSIQDILEIIDPITDCAWKDPDVRPFAFKTTVLLLGGVCINDAHSPHPGDSEQIANICLFTLLEVQDDPEALTIAAGFLCKAKYAVQKALLSRDDTLLSVLRSLSSHSENEMITAALCSFTRRLVTPKGRVSRDIKELLLLGGGVDLFKSTLSRFPKKNEIVMDSATIYLYLRDYDDKRRAQIRSASFSNID